MKGSRMTLFLVIVLALGACANQQPARAPASPQLTAAPVGERVNSREVMFQTEDGVTLGGTLFGQGNASVVLSHMYPTDQTSWHTFARALAEKGYLALAYDFRGYGKSGGEKRIDRIDRDVRAAAAFLRGQGAQRIVLIGASMGGMVSAKVAGSIGASGLIVISGPQSFQGLSVTEDDLKSFKGPSLWIGSRGDLATVSTEAMHALANEPKTIHIYDGSAHGTYIFDTADGADLIQRLLDFVSTNLPPGQ